MKDILNDEQNKAILDALDEAIKNGPWDKSNFLRAIGKNLNEIRDDFAKKANARSREQVKTDIYLASRLALRSNQQEIFISLYSADGSNLQSWERIIVNLPRQMISRPIYAEEEQVKALLKTKENKQNEAYVAIYINSTDIIPLHPDKAIIDKLGNTLLTLKDKTLHLENISRFVHISGVYQFTRGRLIKEH
ncbi:Dot/Icm secretion system protein IcmQ [Legionella cincinnatiensis]|uniref:IcmQ protein n=1 Tax=Legionella cincinnatiensis TaxID=28085 RepID=A0A378IN52_9GAMM|nr:Dot/Icm secretion system protein IcmQ [Legionella cincinnatiensis]KTC83930.1 IcmQ protein [Legionella cincinnatiensis]STX36222.1 IcmQ protein [Legionella cincinnatiensis]